MSARRIRERRALTAALAGVALAAPASASAECADATLEAEPATIERVRAAILCEINERRAGNGRDPLRASPYLAVSAGLHSADMVEHDYLEHEAAGRPTLFARVRAGGYFDGVFTALYSENIGVVPVGAASARRLVDAWMLSPGHVVNILHERFRDLGVGAAFAGPSRAFYPEHDAVVITTDFGRRELQPTRAITAACRARPRRAAPLPEGSAAPRVRWCRRPAKRRRPALRRTR